MKIKFCKFDEKYLKELIHIHRVSFKDHFNSKLGNNYADNLLKWFVNDTEYNSIFLIAVDADTRELIGYMCGALDGFQQKFNKDLFFNILFAFFLRPYLLFHPKFWRLFNLKLRAFFGKNEHPEFEEFERKLPLPIFSVNAFALSPKYREMGFGYFLLDKFFEVFFDKVKSKGGKTVSATIWLNNKPIQHYYKLKKWNTISVLPKAGTLNYYKIL